MEAKGIVLGSIDYKETSRIVYLYTPLGSISIKAVGANKPKNGLLGFITTSNIVSFSATDSKFPSLIDYEIEKSILISETDLRVLEAIRIMFEVIKIFPNDINHSSTYSFVEHIILNINKANYKKALLIFLIKLTYNFGVSPSLKACVICGSKNNLATVSPTLGGAICSRCTSHTDLELYRICYEYYYEKKEIELYSDCDYNSLYSFIREYYKNHVHISLDFKNILD